MNGTEQVRPSSRYYLLAFLFFVAGISASVYFLFTDIPRIRNSMVRMDIPGQMDLELKKHETYTVFVEHANRSAGAPVQSWSISCGVHALPAGEEVAAKSSGSTTNYTYGTRSGTSILEFDAPHDGTYMLGCTGPSEIYGQKVQAAIGGGASKSITAMIGKIFLVLTGGIVIGALTFVRVAMLRLQSRKEIREQGLKPV